MTIHARPTLRRFGLILPLIAAAVWPAWGQDIDLMRYNAVMLQADTCIAQRQFDCASDRLAEATSLVPKGPSVYRERLQDAKRRLSQERQALIREEHQREREAKQHEHEAERQKHAEEQKLERERKAKERQDAAQAERERKAKERQDAAQAERERKAKEREDKAQAARQKAQEVANEKREQADYLHALESGTKLYARKCPDGEGKYYMVGKRPRIKPEKVSCIDVHFEARCPGSARGVTGVSRNFVGMATDCFMGDTTAIEPKPACPVDQVSVLVRSVRPCQ